ncbi:MAG: hypothetical protein PQ612_02550 [Rickettsiales bacterium]|nr:hypothetical protein [Pseudomonadota bacterium]MDA0966007.1 hypothetical protein [Pseudomonadota bacterium]MDG4542522.1 hypothetical protein [Rickettsiales bacterium]MDG4545026.1 hypothetical protein [Rickettsiales bacterium]MDG4547149.1 hypothetical protein [Rickettsiales bacterium]
MKKLKAEDIDDAEVQPSSLILKLARSFSTNLKKVLDGWQDNVELNEIFYRIAGETKLTKHKQINVNRIAGISEIWSVIHTKS